MGIRPVQHRGLARRHAVRRIAAPPEALDAMFKQAGIIQVESLEEMFDVAQLLAHQPLPRGRRVAVVGNSDALALLAVDAAAGGERRRRSLDRVLGGGSRPQDCLDRAGRRIAGPDAGPRL